MTVLSASMHEAPYVLDGLMHHSTSLNIAEHYANAGDATDHVFALFALLGFRFCARLCDFPDRRLTSAAALANYLLFVSLKAGHVARSIMLKKPAAYERQN